MEEIYFLYRGGEIDHYDVVSVTESEIIPICDVAQHRLNVHDVNPESNFYGYLVDWVKSGKTNNLIEKRDGTSVTCSKARLNRGEFHPRVFRPIHKCESMYANHPLKIGDLPMLLEWHENIDYFDRSSQPIILSNQVQLNTLLDLLRNIFSVIAPSEQNFNTYGHALRNFIILCATEVETQLRGILKANDYVTKNKSSLSTKDYVKSLPLLKLNEYSVKFKYYPELPNFTPFIGWDEVESTKSLEWYDNYNAVKHDREKCFKKSTLKSALDAICACVILSVAQFGEKQFQSILQHHFEITTPDFVPEEHYFEPTDGVAWTAKPAVIN